MNQKDQFNEYRTRMNEKILASDNKVLKRYFNLDTNAFLDGALPSKTKELLGLVASVVLRCDDCIKYHLGRCHEVGYSKDEIFESLSIASIIGGTVVSRIYVKRLNIGKSWTTPMIKRDLDLERKWQKLRLKLGELVGRRPKDLNAILFLIGTQELGRGPKEFTKEEKQDLMHIAICKILSFSGFYELEGLDEEGWPHWKNVKKLPVVDLLDQEKMLKMHVIEYFEKDFDGEII